MKNAYLLPAILFMSLFLILPASAITGSIGNARMILRLEKGETIEKSILVKNVNDIAVEIEMFASGDLEGYIEIKDEKFTLQPDEEKKAGFTLEAGEDGTTESRINVKFTPTDGGNGVGLSSTIIVVTGTDSDDDATPEENPDEENTDSQENPATPLTGKVTEKIKQTNPATLLVILAFSIFTILLMLLLVLLVIKKNKLKKEVNRHE